MLASKRLGRTCSVSQPRRPRLTLERLEERLLLAVAYAVQSDGDDNLYQIDVNTGAAARIGPVGFSDVEGIAFNPSTGVLYGVDDVTDQLIKIDITTGAGTVVGALGENVEDTGLSFDYAGNLYMSTATPGNLYKVNPNTGAATLIGAQGQNVTGLAFGPDGTGGYVLFGLGGGGANNLVSLDTSTGAATAIGPLTSVAVPGQGGIDFYGGVLYGIEDTGQIFTINTATGTATTLSTTLAGFEELAFRPEADLVMTYNLYPDTTLGTGNGFLMEAEVVNAGSAPAINVEILTRVFGFPMADITVQSAAFSVSQSGGAITQFTAKTGSVTGADVQIGDFRTDFVDVGGVVRLRFRVLTVRSGVVFSAASVTADTLDPALANNTADVALTVVPNIYIDDHRNLIIRDVASEGRDDHLTLAVSGSNLVISDPGNTLTLGSASGYGGVQSIGLSPANSVNVALTSFDRIIVETGYGDDSLTVDNTGGLVPAPIFYDGGDGFDRLVLTGTTAVGLAKYEFGPNPDEGRVSHTGIAATQTVQWKNIEPIVDVVPGQLDISGTPADNAISYTGPGLNSNGILTGVVTVDNYESVEFANKTLLAINGMGGNDTISLNNPTTPTGLASIMVAGGDPTAGSDTVVVNGTSAANSIVIDQLTTDGARITGAQPVPVTVVTTEHLIIDGNQGADMLTVETPDGFDLISLQDDDATADAGSIRIRHSLGTYGPDWLPISFMDLGASRAGGGLVFTDAGGGRADELGVYPRNDQTSDQFVFLDNNVFELQETSGTAPNLQLPPISGPGVSDLVFNSLGGDDFFWIAGDLVYNTLLVNGGEPSGSDELFFVGNRMGTAHSVTLNYGAQSIQEQGFGPVWFRGIETIDAYAGPGSLMILGTAGNDAFNVRPTGATTAVVTPDAGPVALVTTTFAGIGGLMLNTLGGNDTVTVEANEQPNAILVSAMLVDVDGPTYLPVSLAGEEALRVLGGAGSDLFIVVPSLTVPITILGGDPIGQLQNPGDVLNILTGGQSINFYYGPEPDSGYVTINGNMAVSFDEIELLQTDGFQYILPDRFEPNDTLATATVLGSLPKITLNFLTLHDDGVPPIDEDWFQITAQDTGKLIINAWFTQDGMPGNGAGGNLDIRLYDDTGGLIASSLSITNNEQIIVPVVGQQRYFLQVLSADSDPNLYHLEIENFAAPVPNLVDLDPAYDSGASFLDNVTNQTQPRIIVEADLAEFALEGIPILTAVQAAAGNVPGAAVQIFVGGLAVGFASPLAGNDLFQYTFGPGQLVEGVNEVKAAVYIVDGQTSNQKGRSQLGAPLTIQLDTAPPAAPSQPDLLPSSDSGVSDSDNITDIDQPAFRGTSEANAHVRVFADGVQVGEGFAGSNGQWEITVEPLDDGVYQITATAEDLAGNFSAPSAALAVTIDTSSPQVPTLDLQDSDDTGWSDTDNVTRGDPAKSPGVMDFRISAEPGSTVHIKDGDLVVDTFVFNAAFDLTDGVADGFGLRQVDFNANQGAFSIPAQGPHPLSVEATDAAGNVRQSHHLLVTVDLTPPDASTPDMLASSDTGPSNTDNVTSIRQPAFSGTAEANARVTIFANGLAVGQVAAGSDESDGIPTNGLGAWEITVEPLADGDYLMTAQAEDAAGNVGPVSPALAVTIDATDPQIPTLDLQDSDDTGWSATDNVTRGDPAKSPGVMDFRISAEPGSTVVIKDGEVVIDTILFNNLFDLTDGVADGFGIRQVNFNAIELVHGIPAQGPHPLTVEATDAAGLVRQSEQLLVTVDFTAPAVPSAPVLAAYSDTGVVGDNKTHIAQPAFIGTGEANAVIRLFADNGTSGPQLIGTAVVGSDESDGNPGNGLGRWEITTEPLTSGTYVLTGQLEDRAGNTTPIPGPTVEVVIDLSPPQRPTLDLLDSNDTGWSNTDNITRGDPAVVIPHVVTLRVTSDLGTTVDVKDGNDVVTTLDFSSATSLLVTLNFNDLAAATGTPAEGPHALSVEAINEVELVSQSDVLLLTLDSTAPAAPSAPDMLASSDSGLSDTDNLTGIAQPAFAGTAEANTRVRILANGVVVGEGLAGSDASDGIIGNGLGAWEITVEPLDDGTYAVQAQSEDLAGNVGLLSGSLQVTIDSTLPQRPTIALLPSSDTGFSDTDGITMGDPLLGPGIVQVRVTSDIGNTVDLKDGNKIVASSLVGPTGEVIFTVNFGALAAATGYPAEGPHPLSVESTEPSGGRAQSLPLPLRIDLTAPAPAGVPDLLPSSDTGSSNDDNLTHAAAPAFSGVGEANAIVRLFADGLQVGAATVGSDSSDGVLGNGLGRWEITSEPLAPGRYAVTASLEDAAGNTSAASSPALIVSVLAPVAAADDLAGVSEDATTGDLSALLLSNDSPPVSGTNVIIAVNTSGTVGVVALDPATHALTYQAAGFDRLAVGQQGEDYFSYTMQDAAGATATAVVRVTVFGVNDPPVITSSPVTVAVEDAPYQYRVKADDADGDALVWSLLDAPPELAIDPDTGVITGTFINCSAGVYNVVVQAQDPWGATGVQSFSLEVQNVGVVFDGPMPSPTETLLIGQMFQFDLGSTDEGQGLTAYSLAAAPGWLSVDPSTGLLSGRPVLSSDIGESAVTVRVSDGHGGSDELTFGLQVQGQIIVLDPTERNTKTRIVDADGDYVSIALKGRGGRVVITRPVADQNNDTPADIWAIEATGTTTSSSLAVSVKRNAQLETGDGATQVDRILGDSPLKSLKGPAVSVAHGVDFSGVGIVQSLILDEVDGFLMMDGDAPKGVTMKLTRFGPGANVVLARAGIRSLSLREWPGSALTAPWATRISVRSKANVGGEWGAMLALTGVGAPAGKPVLGSFSCDRQLAGEWAVHGDVGTIKAGSIGQSWHAEIDGAVKSVVSLSKASGMLEAGSLGTLSVKGIMQGLEVRTTDSINSVSARQMIGSAVYAGVRDDVTGLPDSPADFAHPSAIGKVSVRGSKGQDGFVASVIAASQLGRISVDTVNPDNAGVAFGVAGQTITQVKFRLDGTAGVYPPDTPPAGSDFKIRDL